MAAPRAGHTLAWQVNVEGGYEDLSHWLHMCGDHDTATRIEQAMLSRLRVRGNQHCSNCQRRADHFILFNRPEIIGDAILEHPTKVGTGLANTLLSMLMIGVIGWGSGARGIEKGALSSNGAHPFRVVPGLLPRIPAQAS